MRRCPKTVYVWKKYIKTQVRDFVSVLNSREVLAFPPRVESHPILNLYLVSTGAPKSDHWFITKYGSSLKCLSTLSVKHPRLTLILTSHRVRDQGLFHV